MNIKNISMNWMNYNNYFMGIVLCVSYLSQTMLCTGNAEQKKDFQQFLQDCNYAPHCIKYLRNKYSQDNLEKVADLNEFLEGHYRNEYLEALKKEDSLEAKLMLLDRMEAHLMLDPYAIEHCQEGPCISSTKDGSDRGGKGLRYKALTSVKKEIESMRKLS